MLPDISLATGDRERGQPVKPVILLKDGEKYCGQYVAMKSFSNRDVVSSGTKPATVLKEAKEKGVKDPVIFYVPKKDSVNIL
jgi:hypothetical protein